MLIKTGKKGTMVLQVIALLLVMSLAIFTAACPDEKEGKTTNIVEEEEEPGNEPGENQNPTETNYGETLSWGTEFTPATLGLNPGNDTTEIRLNWYSAGAPAGKFAKVRFIKGTKAEGTELKEVDGTVAAASSGFVQHKAVVTGLEPGASYQYSVSTDGTNWSPMYNFKIPAKTGAFKFAVIADPQLTMGNVDVNSRYNNSMTTASGWLQTMEKIVAAGVSFIASGGDQVDAGGGNENEYTNLFAPTGLRSLPLAPVRGNHDAHAHFDYHFNIPNEQIFDEGRTITNGGNYFYLYNNILFVVLNTAPYPNNTVAAGPYLQYFGQTLQAAVAANSGKYDWLIVQHHKSTASVGDHVADNDIQYYVEAGFETLMSYYNVDFVLAGHDHVYARSYPLKGMHEGRVSVPMKTGFDPASGSTWVSPMDPIYLTFTTGSGLKYYAVSSDKTYEYNNTLYVKNNASYPYLGETEDDGVTSTFKGSIDYMTNLKLPVSNAAYVQPYIPSYCIVEVNGRSITFKTYPIFSSSLDNKGTSTAIRSYVEGQPHNFDLNTPYDVITVTK